MNIAIGFSTPDFDHAMPFAWSGSLATGDIAMPKDLE